ncbi:MAG: hypothetical protein HGA45_29880, partial [Chloroflexales bacterium]|nr:hypothetical protein [Chloroflexales bacterium]
MKGIHLSLLIGPAVPRPAPKAVIEALTEVQVQTQATGQSGFQLGLAIGKGSAVERLLLAGFFEPAVRVIIVVTINGAPVVLSDGVITQQDLAPGKAGQSSLNLTGLDLSAVMDVIDATGIPLPPGVPTFALVGMLLSKYAPLGIMPNVVPSVPEHIESPLERVRRQVGTDLSFITGLAREVGYVFYLEPGPLPGLNTAYWGPEVRAGLPQPPLNVNMDHLTNVESLSFSYDGLAKELPVAFVLPKCARVPIPVPVPDVSRLKPPLGALPTPARRVTQMRDVSRHDFAEALLLSLGGAARSADALTASGQ